MKSVMDGTVDTVQDRCTNAMNHPQLIELLKEIEDSGFNEFNVIYQCSLFELWKRFTKIYCTGKSNFLKQNKYFFV